MSSEVSNLVTLCVEESPSLSSISLLERFFEKTKREKRGLKKRDRRPGLDSSDQSLRDVFKYVS
jgi:hypothetical protein